MKKSIFFWLYFIVAIILAIYFATRITMTYMGKTKISQIHHINIEMESQDTDSDVYAAAIGLSTGTNVYKVNLSEINDRINKVPGTKTSAVRKLPNGNLVIKTEQYKAVALWADANNVYYPLSSDGVKIDIPSEIRQEGAILFKGEIPENLSEIIKAVTAISTYVDYMEWIENRRWNIHTNTGITIYLPENQPIAAINKVSVLQQKHNLLHKKLDLIDMRDSARILITERK